jgi:glyoxylase-like metal-dependent hydrolase (beta-lactamase superfamily II)
MSPAAEHVLSNLPVYRIQTPHAASTAATNCYFIDGAMPTLVDTGVATDEAYGAIDSGLASIGRAIDDVQQIVITHGHADHRALAPRVQAATGAEVFCHRLEIDKIVVRSPKQEAEHATMARRVFRSMGVPEENLTRLVTGPRSPAVAPRLDRVSLLDEGNDLLCGDLVLRVLHAPGHSCGSMCLHDERNGILFAGDTLLASSHISALLETDLLGEDPDYNALQLHVDGLQRLLRLQVSRVFPGHGDVIVECESIVEALLERYKKRQRHILRSLRKGRRTAYEICRSVFPFATQDDLYLTLSEVAGNLGILLKENEILRTCEDEVAYYERAP